MKKIYMCFLCPVLLFTGCSAVHENEHSQSAQPAYGSREETSGETTETNETSVHTSTAEMSRIEKIAKSVEYDEGESLLSSPPQITYQYSDEDYEYYSFIYGDEEFSVLHDNDNWKIFESYKIRNSEDMKLICQAMIDIDPVHGADMSSYRTTEDMAYEWIQHNIVYDLPGLDDEIKDSAANVDMDPKDQNMTIMEMYYNR